MKLDNFFSILTILVVSVFAILVATGYKRFVVWPQITDHYRTMIYSQNPILLCTTIEEQKLRLSQKLMKLEKVNLNEIALKCGAETSGFAKEVIAKEEDDSFYGLLTSISHNVRLGIFYPIITAGVLLNTNIHLIFSIVCILCILLTSYLLGQLFEGANTRFAVKIYLLFFSFLSLFMNGRILISFLSIAFLLWAIRALPFQVKSRARAPIFVLSIFFSFILSNVSSGTNLIILALFLFYLLTELRFKNISTWTCFGIAAACIFQFVWVIAGLAKNLKYYEGDLLGLPGRLFGHGVGQLTKYSFAIPTLTILALIGAFLIYKYKRNLQNILWMGLLMFTLGGLFGFSVLSGTLIFILTLGLERYLPKRTS